MQKAGREALCGAPGAETKDSGRDQRLERGPKATQSSACQSIPHNHQWRMFAIHLQSLLTELCREAEMCHWPHDDMEQRFQSLRGYGRLPRGRENRGRPLTDEQIASAILGLSITMPGWAGHAAAVMERRLPVGGSANAFADATTLRDALVKILSDEAIRGTVIAVQISTAECGVNSHGIASILYKNGDVRRRTSYVPKDAVSLLQLGAEDRFDPDQPYTMFGRGVTFNRRFFDRLSKRIAEDRKWPPPLPDDSAEYDTEEAERARRNRLRATNSSNYLNVGVDNHVTWPREETLIEFDQYHMVLMPKTRENVQSISIDLYANRLTHEQAKTVINRFLSLLCWCDDHFAIVQDGWSGNPVPVPVKKRDLAFTTTYRWLFDRKLPTSGDVLKALAYYREARNAEHNFMVSYAVLNYYKIIEIQYPGWPDSTQWVSQNLPAILNDPRDQHGIQAFLDACGHEKPETYIYAACRVAVAHASPHRISDPDEAAELERLHNAADIMRRLARRFIIDELGFSDTLWEPEEGQI